MGVYVCCDDRVWCVCCVDDAVCDMLVFLLCSAGSGGDVNVEDVYMFVFVEVYFGVLHFCYVCVDVCWRF